MRLLAAFLVLAESDFPVKIDRTLQPRHPQNRNARLHKFAQQWLETNIISNKYRERIWMRWQKWGQKMQAAFDRPQCGYFDPEKPNDGDPSPHQNHKLGKMRKSRSKRSTDSDTDGSSSGNWNDLTDEEWMEELEKSAFEMLFDPSQGDVSLRGRKDLITQNPERAIKNILNGFRRYARRYIAGCHGERVNQSHSSRAKKFTEKLLKYYQNQMTKQ